MATKITMPQLGESVVDGSVSEWLKQVGDTVDEYEPIVRISTDKVDSEIPAPAAGVLLAIHVAEGETVDAGTVLGVIGQSDEEVEAVEAVPATANGHHPAEQPAQVEKVPAKQPASTGSSGGYSGHVTPVVARMVAEHDLDLTQIDGSGRNGRITKRDVLAYLENQANGDSVDEIDPWDQPVDGDLFKPTVEYGYDDDDEPAQPAPKPAASQPAPKPTPTPPAQPVNGSIPGELQAMTGMRRAIAEHMVRSRQTSPHATVVFEVDLSKIVAHRAAHRNEYGKQGVKLTYTPYFVMATAQALMAHPIVNARWTDEGLYYHHVANIGMAAAIPDGLIVPVIKNAQDYNLMGLARIVEDLAKRARDKQLKPDEVRDGTFTITNHGVGGSIIGAPIINQPQSAILGIGAIEKRVKVINDAIAIRPCAYLSLTIDHRVIDGATADAFMRTLKETLESWA